MNDDRAQPPVEFSQNKLIEKQELLSRLYWSTIIRLGIVTVLLSVAIVTYQYKIIFTIAPWLSPLIILIVVLYAVSITELFALRRGSGLVSIAYIATSWDVLFVSALVIATGGIDSIYTFLYLLVAIEGGFLLSRKGALIFASASSILYGLLVDAQFYRLFPSFIPTPEITHIVKDILVNLITYISTAFILGVLSAYLGSSLLKARQALSMSSIGLRHLANLHSIIINSTDSGLITLDERSAINTVNPAAARITGYTPDELATKKIEDIIPKLRLSGHAAKRNEAVLLRRDDHRIPVGYTISDLQSDAGIRIGAVITFQDLTEMKKMEAKLKRSDILATAGRLAASVAHEIRNPLASISGAVQLLMEDLKGRQEYEKLLELIFREVDRINSLVTEFLAMSKPVTNIRQGIIIRQLIDEVYEDVSRRSDYSPSIMLQTSVKGDLKITTDALKMKQVLLNLVLNAIHAIKGNGAVNVDCILRDNRAIVSVEDNGEGMDENEARMSVEPFWTTTPGGTGLGLPVVQSIIEQHNGTLGIKSEKGRGTVVTVELPL